MDVEQAKEIAGTLSKTGKMPGYSTSIPAWFCKTGSKLAKRAGSVCSKCYALRGRYRFGNVKAAMERRAAGLTHPRWVEAMTLLIQSFQAEGHFRWFDSGDFQSVSHISKVMEVCHRTPSVKHWIPTHEVKMYDTWLQRGGVKPKNVLVRFSADMLDETPPPDRPGSMVYTGDTPPTGAWDCPARFQGNRCLTCRKCWSETKLVAYPLKVEGKKHYVS
jgi:hypothetical protein